MRTPLRSRTLMFAALVSLGALPACVGGMPHRRPGSDLITRRGPSSAPWWSSLVACSALADSAKKSGASGSAKDCADAQPGEGTMREPQLPTGQKKP